MTSALLMLGLLLPAAPVTLAPALTVQLAANEAYCGRAAVYATEVAQRSGDLELADAAQMVRDAAASHYARDLEPMQQDAAVTLAQKRSRYLSRQFERTQSRAVLEDALIGCAATL